MTPAPSACTRYRCPSTCTATASSRPFGHTTTDQIEKTYGHVAKVRLRVEGFDYETTLRQVSSAGEAAD
ncbi:MAG TPA: hypothetical protein VNV25_20080 [Gemmatimonadaceae bacterium]|jgi:hypothetical protein|nr:hypothetical protein [Gemmatimonadaceae bacterium]